MERSRRPTYGTSRRPLVPSVCPALLDTINLLLPWQYLVSDCSKPQYPSSVWKRDEPESQAAVQDCALATSLSSVASPGFHVLCLSPAADNPASTTVVAFVSGLEASEATAFAVPNRSVTLDDFMRQTAGTLQLPRRLAPWQPAALFAASGLIT
jgi:hypothetical protein